MFIDWSTKNDDSEVVAILNPNSLSTAPSELGKYVEGFKRKDNGPVYLQQCENKLAYILFLSTNNREFHIHELPQDGLYD